MSQRKDFTESRRACGKTKRQHEVGNFLRVNQFFFCKAKVTIESENNLTGVEIKVKVTV